MKSDELIEVTKAMKLEILDIILNANLSSDKEAQLTILTIDDMFERLGLKVEEVIPEDTLRSYFKGVDEATKALSAAGINPIGGLGASISTSGQVASAFATQVHMNAIAEITDNTMLDLKAAIRTAQQNTYFTLMTTLQDVKEDLQKGVIQGKARRVITQRVSESFAKEGMTSFITIDGKRLPLDFYSETVVRTNIKMAHTKGAGERYRENGMDLFTVTGGTPTCHQCAPLRGIVFTLNPDRKDYTYMNPRDIIRHPNCNCSMSVWVEEYKTESEIKKAQRESKAFNPDKDTRSKSQKEAYEEQQRLHRINNYDKKRYAEMLSILGEERMPKGIGAFKRMKRSNSDNYKKLLQDYQDALKAIK
ncbi:phage minor capsid protein [Oceanobacillus sp. Castelsardo]|uniref:phage minor capsid protein n=1 Tax=Oceanobacillus sp. Castelsardo TaxID=1851204 RepID=UPI0008394431|nr:phage minor capsid protein [Oceanobacillus sp. Castelsardo]